MGGQVLFSSLRALVNIVIMSMLILLLHAETIEEI